jgi:glycosyltransferase involved in cell wall biosynthesis
MVGKAAPAPDLDARGERPRILFVVTEDWYFVSHRLPMARAALAAGFDVHVATHMTTHADAIGREGFTVHHIPFARGSIAPGATWMAVRALRRVHRDVAPAIVHRVALQAIVIDALAAWRSPAATVNAITGFGHSFIATTAKARALRGLICAVLRHAARRAGDVMLVQNPDDAKLLTSIGIPRERIETIPGSGVDVVGFQPLPEPADPGIGFAGRLIADKGIGTLIAAYRLLRARGTDLTLVIAGAPDPKNPGSVSEDELAAWRSEPGIVLLGQISDIAALWTRVQIAVLPSRGEGLPLSLLEAAACARPLIASDVPGCREIAIPGDTGILVPPDDAEALADAISDLLNSRERRVRMGRAARRYVELRFSADAIGRATAALYRRILGDAQQAHRQ